MVTKALLKALQQTYERWPEGDWRSGQDLLSDDVAFVTDDPLIGPSTYLEAAGLTE